MTDANHRIRETCLICEGLGRHENGPCAYCSGSGIVFSRTAAPKEILVATGNCRVPIKKKFAESVAIQRKFS